MFIRLLASLSSQATKPYLRLRTLTVGHPFLPQNSTTNASSSSLASIAELDNSKEAETAFVESNLGVPGEIKSLPLVPPLV